MMKVDLVWVTPDAEKLLGFMARVSNPKATKDDSANKLIKYLIDHKHWSPFEMVNLCVEIQTTRDIARQILRHRSFHFQELSQRYAVVDEEPEFAEARLQDRKNRQNSIPTDDPELESFWFELQTASWECEYLRYKEALDAGIAKELARKLLPEGLTRTHMYMQGTVRDWLHYIAIREGVETQFEHREIAHAIREVLSTACPSITQAAEQAGIIAPGNPVAANT
ncbi:MAG: thymidylate synthase (FAD) [Rhodospirillales bacterium 20-64-7]|nr:MAG: thymidylate synthase (FAD) [Rhodospirillales bacterium 20-64-7]